MREDLLTEQATQESKAEAAVSFMIEPHKPHFPVTQTSPAQCGEGTAQGPRCQEGTGTGWLPHPDSLFAQEKPETPDFISWWQ